MLKLFFLVDCIERTTRTRTHTVLLTEGGKKEQKQTHRPTDKTHTHNTHTPSHRPGGPAPGPPASRGAAHSTRRMRLS